MAASVSTTEAAPTLRPLKQPSPPHKPVSTNDGSPQQIAVRDRNKRRCVASTDALQTPSTQTIEGSPQNAATSVPCAAAVDSTSLSLYGNDCTCGNQRLNVRGGVARESCEEKRQFPTEDVMREVEDEGGGGVLPQEEIVKEIAVVAAKHEELHVSVASLKRKFSLREDHSHQLLLGLGTLNAVNNALATLQKEYQDCAAKNAALVQELLVQIAKCSAQVDALKKSRGLKAKQLQQFKHECAQEMNRLISRLEDLADSTCQEHNPKESKNDDVLRTAASMRKNLQQVEQLKEEVAEHRDQVTDDQCVKSAGGRLQKETTDRTNLALQQLDNLHADMFQLKQALVEENQSFRQHLEDHLSRQIAHTRELQDNERERVYEEMDEIRSGMCGILKDIHRLKERTKYLVPSMAQVPPLPSKVIGRSSEDRWMSIQTPSSAPPVPCERSYDWVMPSQMEGHHALPYHPHSTKSGNVSPERSGDENWRTFTPEDAPATDQRAPQPCESPHYSSRSSSLSGHLSVYGEENGKPSAEQFDRQLLEQHRLFWIGEGAG